MIGLGNGDHRMIPVGTFVKEFSEHSSDLWNKEVGL
jgi:hypothetical protein